MKILIDKLETIFTMNNEYLTIITKDDLKLRIEGVRSSTIGSQFVCVVRARDAYMKSILDDRPFTWEPDYPYEDRFEQDKMYEYTSSFSKESIDKLREIETLSDNQMDLLMDLIAHEYMHQGQLIRYYYANNLKQGSLTKTFWHLEE